MTPKIPDLFCAILMRIVRLMRSWREIVQLETSEQADRSKKMLRTSQKKPSSSPDLNISAGQKRCSPSAGAHNIILRSDPESWILISFFTWNLVRRKGDRHSFYYLFSNSPKIKIEAVAYVFQTTLKIFFLWLFVLSSKVTAKILAILQKSAWYWAFLIVEQWQPTPHARLSGARCTGLATHMIFILAPFL